MQIRIKKPGGNRFRARHQKLSKNQNSISLSPLPGVGGGVGAPSFRKTPLSWRLDCVFS